jgi:protein-tyrosine-phosphatase
MAAAERHNVDLTSHRSRLVTADLVRAADLIVVMDPTQRRQLCERFGRQPTDVILLGDFDPAPVEMRTIRDPVEESREVFDQVYERIARCVRELVSVLGSAAA